MIISEATEFIRNLGNLPKNEEKKVVERIDSVELPEEESITIKQENIEKVETERRVHFEDMDVDVKVKEEETTVQESDETGFQAEPLVSAGLGATLALLSQKGLVQRLSPEEQERANKLRERELWLVEQRKKEKIRLIEMEKERDIQRASGRKLSGRDMERQREADAKRLEREQIKLKEEKFKNYVPDVKIAYYDEFGRELNTKEVLFEH